MREQARPEVYALVQILSNYKCLRREQIHSMFPQLQPRTLDAIIAGLVRQHRLYWDKDHNFLSDGPDVKPDPQVIRAVWVLLDFVDSVVFHTCGDFPFILTFFTEHEEYEVIAVPYEMENLVHRAIWNASRECSAKRIILIDTAIQIPNIQIDGTSAYCTVSEQGKAQYYRP